jgi:hypothetical protein
MYGTGNYGIFLTTNASSNTIITNNFIESNTYSIRTFSGNENVRVYDNTLKGTFVTIPNMDIKRNTGYITENFGAQEVYNTNTTTTITHGLAGTPTSISLTPTWDASAYISGVDATEFNVTFTDPTATKNLYWEAYYSP